MMEKRMIAAGTRNYLAISPQYSDEQIIEYVEAIYGWKAVTIERKPHIILVQPMKQENGRDGSRAV